MSAGWPSAVRAGIRSAAWGCCDAAIRRRCTQRYGDASAAGFAISLAGTAFASQQSVLTTLLLARTASVTILGIATLIHHPPLRPLLGKHRRLQAIDQSGRTLVWQLFRHGPGPSRTDMAAVLAAADELLRANGDPPLHGYSGAASRRSTRLVRRPTVRSERMTIAGPHIAGIAQRRQCDRSACASRDPNKAGWARIDAGDVPA